MNRFMNRKLKTHATFENPVGIGAGRVINSMNEKTHCLPAGRVNRANKEAQKMKALQLITRMLTQKEIFGLHLREFLLVAILVTPLASMIALMVWQMLVIY